MKGKIYVALKIRSSLILIIIFLCIFNCANSENNNVIKLGIDVLLQEKLDLLKNKKVAVITNQTGVDSQGNHIIDLLDESPAVKLVALFSPEHGIRGDIEGGFMVENNIDKKTAQPIFSLYC